MDSEGCTTSCNVTINEPSAEITCSATEDSPVVCTGESNGQATVTPAGGNGGYTYLWDNGETTATATLLSEGFHTVEIEDAKGCTNTCGIYISQPVLLHCSAFQIAEVTCNGESDGVAEVTHSGGTGNVDILWDNGETTITATALDAGVHTVEITDENNCITSCTVTINEPSNELTCTATEDNPVECHGESNGQATVSPVGGNGGYTYLWDNGESTATATALNAGLHTVTVTDVRNCTTTCTVTISQPEAINCSIRIEEYVPCNCQAEGSATVDIIGGNGSNSFLWSNGETTQTAVALDIGIHSVTVTDIKGCETECQIDLEQDPNCCHTVKMNGFMSSYGKGK